MHLMGDCTVASLSSRPRIRNHPTASPAGMTYPKGAGCAPSPSALGAHDDARARGHLVGGMPAGLLKAAAGARRPFSSEVGPSAV
jgi:hypothetical protein